MKISGIENLRKFKYRQNRGQNPGKPCLRILTFLLAIWAFGVGTFPVKAIVIRPEDAFTEDQNPSGGWSYGWATSRTGSFQLFDDHYMPIPNVVRWVSSGLGTFPFINYQVNPNGDAVGFHPGPSGENAILRWTVPSSGDLTVSARFWSGDPTLGATTDVAVLHNGTELASGDVTPTTGPEFDLSFSVAPGDFVDFTVGFGSDGSYFFDSTGLNLTLDLTPRTEAVPDGCEGLNIVGAIVTASMFLFRKSVLV